MDFLFLKIRSKSIGEVITALYRCNNQVLLTDIEPIAEDIVDEFHNHHEGVKYVSCNTEFKVFVNLEDVTVKFPEEYSSVLELTPTMGLKLKSPSFKTLRDLNLKNKNITDITDEYIYACVESIYDGDNIYLPEKDFNFQELKDFIDKFPSSAIDQFANFFTHQPSINLVLRITCPKCGNVSVIELNGLNDFFS